MVAINPRSNRAPEQHCSIATLRRLLDETLGDLEASAAETHLACCDRCRTSLESIVGDQAAWAETREVLSDSFDASSGFQWLSETNTQRSIGNDAANLWLASILAPGPPSAMGRLGRYDVLKVIGVGGMGVVVSAIDPKLSRPVAIKLLAPHLAPLGTARRRFARESRAVAAVVHPSIMPIYGIHDDDVVPYLVMPLVPGGSLQTRVDRDGPLNLEEVIGIGIQIAEGLAAAHQQGIVHRDIKPGNILLEENSARIMITDFGLARALDDASATVSGMIAGTPQYMSPEQASGSRVDHRSDLFSLGSVLYTLATGAAPFRAESPVAVLRRIADDPARPPSEVREELPPWFDRLIERFLEKDPDRRIETADEARLLLHDVQLHLRRPGSNALPRDLVAPRPERTRLVKSVLLAVFAAATLLIAVPLIRRSDREDQSPSIAIAQSESRRTGDQHSHEAISHENTSEQTDSQSIAPANTNPSPAEDAFRPSIDEAPSQSDPAAAPTDWTWTEFHSTTQEISRSLSVLEWNLQVVPHDSQGDVSDE